MIAGSSTGLPWLVLLLVFLPPQEHLVAQFVRGAVVVEPVSYTHLDVYKRQLLKGASTMPDAYLVAGITAAGACAFYLAASAVAAKLYARRDL